MARLLYVFGTLASIGSAFWVFEVLRATGAFQRTLDHQMMIARAAAIPLGALLGGLLIIAFGILLARLKAIQYAGELSADALAEIASRDRGPVASAADQTKPPIEPEVSLEAQQKAIVGKAVAPS